MHTQPDPTAFDLSGRVRAQIAASAMPTPVDTALDLLDLVLKIAASAEPDELSFISWRFMQHANDLSEAVRRAHVAVSSDLGFPTTL